MKRKTLMSVKSVICLIFGIAFVILPALTASLFGLALDEAGMLVARLFGAAFIGLGLWLWLERSIYEEESRRAVLVAVSISDLLGGAIMVYALLNGLGNMLAWTIAALYLLFAAGFGYLLFAAPEGKLAV